MATSARVKICHNGQLEIHRSNHQLQTYTDFPEIRLCCAKWKIFEMYFFRNSFDESTMSDEYKQNLNGMRQASSRNENRCLRSAQEKVNLKENKDGTVSC